MFSNLLDAVTKEQEDNWALFCVEAIGHTCGFVCYDNDAASINVTMKISKLSSIHMADVNYHRFTVTRPPFKEYRILCIIWCESKCDPLWQNI